MRPGARTPEELETLFEDAFVIRDRDALARCSRKGRCSSRAEDRSRRAAVTEIARFATAMWDRDYTYVADPRRVLQARDTALVVADRGINVVRRGSDGGWRYAISFLDTNDTIQKGGAMTQDTTQAQLDPVAVRSDEGEARWWFGALAVIKATAADTGGQMTIVEVTEPPGAEAPLHVHHREDEGFWVLEGNVTFEVGGTKIEASAGDYVFGPRDIPHRYTVGDAGCRMLFIMHPGRLRGPGQGHERARRQPHAPPAVRRGARHGADRGGRPQVRLRASRWLRAPAHSRGGLR